eukprot:snap_masked-scaffold_15-processed-gene-10.8-mRNA-1 protein AED:1.00 eAED:1.00 QI:0/-1/0/0/-1/1/1/0/792
MVTEEQRLLRFFPSLCLEILELYNRDKAEFKNLVHESLDQRESGDNQPVTSKVRRFKTDMFMRLSESRGYKRSMPVVTVSDTAKGARAQRRKHKFTLKGMASGFSRRNTVGLLPGPKSRKRISSLSTAISGLREKFMGEEVSGSARSVTYMPKSRKVKKERSECIDPLEELERVKCRRRSSSLSFPVLDLWHRNSFSRVSNLALLTLFFELCSGILPESVIEEETQFQEAGRSLYERVCALENWMFSSLSSEQVVSLWALEKMLVRIRDEIFCEGVRGLLSLHLRGNVVLENILSLANTRGILFSFEEKELIKQVDFSSAYAEFECLSWKEEETAGSFIEEQKEVLKGFYRDSRSFQSKHAENVDFWFDNYELKDIVVGVFMKFDSLPSKWRRREFLDSLNLDMHEKTIIYYGVPNADYARTDNWRFFPRNQVRKSFNRSEKAFYDLVNYQVDANKRFILFAGTFIQKFLVKLHYFRNEMQTSEKLMKQLEETLCAKPDDIFKVFGPHFKSLLQFHEDSTFILEPINLIRSEMHPFARYTSRIKYLEKATEYFFSKRNLFFALLKYGNLIREMLGNLQPEQSSKVYKLDPQKQMDSFQSLETLEDDEVQFSPSSDSNFSYLNHAFSNFASASTLGTDLSLTNQLISSSGASLGTKSIIMAKMNTQLRRRNDKKVGGVISSSKVREYNTFNKVQQGIKKNRENIQSLEAEYKLFAMDNYSLRNYSLDQVLEEPFERLFCLEKQLFALRQVTDQVRKDGRTVTTEYKIINGLYRRSKQYNDDLKKELNIGFRNS